MKTHSLLLSSLVLLGVCACSAEESSASTAAPHPAAPPVAPPVAGPAPPLLAQEELAAVWPEPGSRVHSTFDLVLGLGQSRVDGRIALLVAGEPLAAGEPVPASARLLPEGCCGGEVELPLGKQSLVVQVLDAQGKSMGPAWSTRTEYEVVPLPAPCRATWLEPQEGATVGRKVKVRFGVEGMGVAPADENVADAAKKTMLDKTFGHHHVLLNQGPMPASMVIPKDAVHLHYGKGQTEAEIELAPGDYTLTMQVADANHRSYGPRLAATIRVKVRD